MIRRDFTSASIEFWHKHEAEKKEIQQRNLKKGIFMVLVFPILFLILTFMFSKKAYAVDYNAIATAYVTTTISQKVVFDSTMQSGGTFTFSVLAHNGGGRSGQSDTANVKIQFYTSANALVSQINSTYSANLPQPSQSGTNGLSGNPQADPAVPWSTLTISSNNCGGSCANVAYATISMYGIDGSYWAGDYGPWYRAPTFTLNGGGNLAYNPEFGPYNGVTAQGWTSSPGFGACQGAWGGSNACIVNDQGQPGQSTAGLVANANGGGPSATGGTTNGQAGGYNSTMSTSNAGAGTGTPQTPPPAPPAPPAANTQTTTQTNILTFQTWDVQHYRSGGWTGTTGANITTGWTWSCTNCGSTTSGTVDRVTRSSDDTVIFVYLLDSNGNMVISEPNGVYTYSGTAPATPTVTGTSTSNQTSSSSSTGTTTTTTNTYNWAGGIYAVTGTSTPTTTTTTTTPVTTTTWSDGTTTSSNGTSTTTTSVTYNYTVTGPSNPPVNPNAGTNTNSVYIQQVNAGSSNKVTANQSGHGNYESITIGGSNNNINIGQGYTFSNTGVATEVGNASNYNVSGLTLSGNSNTAINSQAGTSNSSIISVTGNSNNATLNQIGNNNQGYSIISGNSNSMIIGQNGNSNIAAVNLYGNNNSATVSQTGNNHGTVLTLINAGGANTVSVTQTGTGDAYSLQQTCTNPAGCGVTIIRNK